MSTPKKAIYCAAGQAEKVFHVVGHNAEAKTVDLATEAGGPAVITAVPLVADSVAGSGVRGAFARPHKSNKEVKEEAKEKSEKKAKEDAESGAATPKKDGRKGASGGDGEGPEDPVGGAPGL